jgi:hypothetical protein
VRLPHISAARGVCKGEEEERIASGAGAGVTEPTLTVHRKIRGVPENSYTVGNILSLSNLMHYQYSLTSFEI